MTKPTEQDMLLDLVRVHHELGYISYTAYMSHGEYSVQTLAKRFYRFSRACAICNLTPSNAARAKPSKTVRTTCILCSGTYDRPKNDPSHRKCERCRRRVGAYSLERSINADFMYAC